MDWKKKTYLYGALFGLAAGLLTAKMMINDAEKNNSEVNMSLEKGAKIGMEVLNTVRKLG